MSKTIHRIIGLIRSLGISARQFDLSIGTANGYTLRMEKNNASVGSDVIERITEVYPQVNLVWLITGKGSMFIEDIGIKAKAKAQTTAEIEAYINQKINEKISEEKKQLLDEILKEIEGLKQKR